MKIDIISLHLPRRRTGQIFLSNKFCSVLLAYLGWKVNSHKWEDDQKCQREHTQKRYGHQKCSRKYD